MKHFNPHESDVILLCLGAALWIGLFLGLIAIGIGWFVHLPVRLFRAIQSLTKPRKS